MKLNEFFKKRNDVLRLVSLNLKSKFLYLVIFSIPAVTLFIGCTIADDRDVYVIGKIYQPPKAIATLWKNGENQNITDRNNSWFKSVYVSGDDVYIVGNESNEEGKSVAKLWKNGIAQNLTDGSKNGDAVSVYVSGNDVYVVGKDDGVPTLWKNGVGTAFIDGETEILSEASDVGIRMVGDRYTFSSVHVSNEDVYIAGYESLYPVLSGKRVAKLWKNGEVQNLKVGSEKAGANSVFVFDGDVYVLGWDGSKSQLWKNGEVQNFFKGERYSEASSVYVSDGDVYVAGNEANEKGIRVAILWKNGIAQNLTDGSKNAYAYAVFVLGKDVYVAGNEENTAILWKNGKTQKLFTAEYGTSAKAVFVK